MPTHTLLVTGASSGFGLEIVHAALKAGHKVIAACRNPELAAEKSPTVSQLGGQWLKLDVTDTNAEVIVRDAVQQYNVDVLINNAGYAMLGSLEEMSMVEFNSELQTNTVGAVRCIKGALPLFRSNRRGTIVNISSAAAHYAAPACTAYAASKFALEGLSEALASEVGVFGIKVIVVTPGAFRTNLVSNLITPESHINAYDGTPARELVKLQIDTNGKQPGDPIKAAQKVLEVSIGVAGGVTGETADGELIRVVLGTDAVGAVQHKIGVLQDTLQKMRDIAKSTDIQ